MNADIAIAIEFGYKCCEQGVSLTHALANTAGLEEDLKRLDHLNAIDEVECAGCNGLFPYTQCEFINVEDPMAVDYWICEKCAAE